MVRLLSHIQVISPPGANDEDNEDSPEDILASAPGLIFTDNLPNQHGDPRSVIVYKSPRFGDVRLRATDVETGRDGNLFSHFLWNAGVLMAVLVESVDDERWGVGGQSVLELGAGFGLGGIVATLAGAREVVISDYPSSAVLANIRQNAERNIPASFSDVYSVAGHEWGDLTSPFALRYKHKFTRVLAADCYWMSAQHLNLVRSMLHFLSLGCEGRVFAIAGFHTGRARVAGFFDTAIQEDLEIEEIYEQDADGGTREWKAQRCALEEDLGWEKRWLVVARLRRRLPGVRQPVAHESQS